MNDKNPYQMIIDDRPIGEIVNAIVSRDEMDLARLAEKLKDAHLVLLADWSSTAIRKREVESTLINGSILLLFSIATVGESRKERFDLLLDDLELSQSQAYRCINTFRCFGKLFLDNEELRQAFVVESLKLLSEPSVSEKARIAALEMARNGKRVTIKQAKAMIAAHTTQTNDAKCDDKNEPRRSKPNSTAKVKSLVEKLSTEFQRPQSSLASKDVDYLINRLEEILSQLVAQKGMNRQPHSNSKPKEVASV